MGTKKRLIAALGLGLMVAAATNETFAVHRLVGVRVAVGPRFYYGPAVRPLRPRVVEVVPANYGRVDFDVNPNKSQIFVDGAFIGIADDLDGWPHTAKLPAGYHDVRIITPDGRTDHRRIFVAAGQELKFNLTF
jgi:hypothetical protein